MAHPEGGAARVPGDPDADRYWLTAAIDLSRQSPPSTAAFSVGALVVARSGEVIATGYSREVDPADHAEEIALRRAAGAELGTATLYSSLEPCLRRASRPDSCAALIDAAGVRRVVIAWREPPLFVPGGGAAWLTRHGIAVIVLPELAAAAKATNQHLLSG
jgi:diaminohydroxyphosphoribosylaminopyrimidine deaminase / 5-amino-6-(5-phosphoribosylamino)uracil reductase